MTRRRSARGRLWAPAGALVVWALCAAPGAAKAYVRYTTGGAAPMPFYWPQSCVPITAYPSDLTDMTPDQTMHAASAAAAAWSGGADLSCTYLQVQVGSSTGSGPVARYDNRNNLVFRHERWCNGSDPSAKCYDPTALAITSVFVDTKTGKMRDGDIEVNASNFLWTDLDLDPAVHGKQDLQNALTHEMGHLIGLDHTCWTDTQPLDANGQPILDSNGVKIPSCANAPQAVRETTMFASAVPGDTSKRTLSPDDQQAVCDIYPIAQDPMYCPAPSGSTDPGCACGVAQAPGRGVLTGGLLGAALLLAGRRRRRARER